ncbi:hypothetical protein vseg_002452 [Gypsophila vaccaria]
MAETSNETKVCLKLIVDIKAKKVVFAGADKQFVDFIFSLISLPLSTVAKVLLLNDKGMAGSIGCLYKSIESLDAQYFERNIKNETVLKPVGPVSVPLLSLYDLPASIRFFKCAGSNHNTISEVGGCCQDGCGNYLNDQRCYYGKPQKTASPSYVKDSVVYMVMDNLEVKPMSIELIKSHVKDFGALEGKQVQVGLHEGLAILKASLETDSVLTDVFLIKV